MRALLFVCRTIVLTALSYAFGDGGIQPPLPPPPPHTKGHWGK